MNFNISAISEYTDSFFDVISQSLTPEQKQVALIATAVFTGLSTLYIASRVLKSPGTTATTVTRPAPSSLPPVPASCTLI